MFLKKASSFINSYWFIYTIGIVVAIVWLTGLEIAGVAVLISVACFTLFVQKSIAPFVTIMGLVTFSVSLKQIPKEMELGILDFANNVGLFVVLGALAVLLLVSVIFHMVKFKREEKSNSLLNTFWLCLVAVALAGLFSDKFDFVANLLVVLIYALSFMMYALYSTNSVDNFKEYIARIVFTAGLIVMFELIVYYANVEDLLVSMQTKAIRVGWGNSNPMATVLGMAVAMGAYLFVKSQNPLYIIGAGFCGLSILFTFSRGNIMAMGLILPFLIFSIIKYSKRKKLAIAIMGAFLLICVIGVVSQWDFIAEAFENMINKGAKNDDRRHLWGYFMDLFSQYPVAGNGFYYADGQLFIPHSITMQILASMGIMGLIAFGWHYYEKYKILVSYKSTFSVFAILSIAMFVSYSFVDMQFYMVYQNFLVLAMISACQQERKSIVVEKAPCLEKDFLKSTKFWVLAGIGALSLVGGVLFAVNAPYADPKTNELIISEMQYAIVFVLLASGIVLFAPRCKKLLGKVNEMTKSKKQDA